MGSIWEPSCNGNGGRVHPAHPFALAPGWACPFSACLSFACRQLCPHRPYSCCWFPPALCLLLVAAPCWGLLLLRGQMMMQQNLSGLHSSMNHG